jgi:hypothetical protein
MSHVSSLKIRVLFIVLSLSRHSVLFVFSGYYELQETCFGLMPILPGITATHLAHSWRADLYEPI